MLVPSERTKLYSKDHLFDKPRKIEKNDIIWIDLALASNNYWGDYTRTIILHNGKCLSHEYYYKYVNNQDVGKYIMLANDIQIIQKEILSSISVDMTFHDLFILCEKTILKFKYINPDIRKNYGHTIVKNLKDRSFIVENDKTPVFGNVIAVEQQIAMPDEKYSARVEDIFYFEKDKLIVL
ncbi:MAG: M24 family metallopeptidase [archaeon]